MNARPRRRRAGRVRVSCGLCLPHCPTFRVTGEEAASPAGPDRGDAQVQSDGAPADAEFVGFMDTCVQCRGCETACPSAVPFGRLMEGTRAALADADDPLPAAVAAARATGCSATTGCCWPARRALAVGAAAPPGARGAARAAGPPAAARRRSRLGARPATDVWLFTGCVMDAWQRDVHARRAARCSRRPGAGVAPARARRAMLRRAARATPGWRPTPGALARRVMASMPGDAPIARRLGRLRRPAEGLRPPARHRRRPRRFSARVRDVHEWLAEHGSTGCRRRASRRGRVIVQDPCHLRHVQRAHRRGAHRARPYVADLVELDDDGLCCGAGGAYATEHRELAGAIRSRQGWPRSIGRRRRSSPAPTPGLHGCDLGGAPGLDVRHPVELTVRGRDPRSVVEPIDQLAQPAGRSGCGRTEKPIRGRFGTSSSSSSGADAGDPLEDAVGDDVGELGVERVELARRRRRARGARRCGGRRSGRSGRSSRSGPSRRRPASTWSAMVKVEVVAEIRPRGRELVAPRSRASAASRCCPRTRAARPASTGERPVCISVSSSNASSMVPNPPGSSGEGASTPS